MDFRIERTQFTQFNILTEKQKQYNNSNFRNFGDRKAATALK